MKSWIQVTLSYSESKALCSPGREILTALATVASTTEPPGRSGHRQIPRHMLTGTDLDPPLFPWGFWYKTMIYGGLAMYISTATGSQRQILTGVRSPAHTHSQVSSTEDQQTGASMWDMLQGSEGRTGRWLTLELQLKSFPLTSCLHLFWIISV